MFGLGLGVFLFFYGFKLLRKARLMECIPTSKIRSIAMGLVEITGKVVPPAPPLTSPFSELPCAFYEYRVYEEHHTKNGSRWDLVRQGASKERFSVEDETGRVFVEPEGAETHLPVNATFMTGLGDSPGEQALKRGLDRLGVSWKSWVFEKSLKVNEYLLAAGEEVYILGAATERAGLVIAKEKAPYFCISTHSEREMLSTMRWKMIGCLWGGPALTAACLWYLMSVFKTLEIARVFSR